MIRRLAAVPLLLLLASCAAQPGQQLTWTKQGASSSEFEQTRYKCLQQSNQAAPVREIVTGVGQTPVDKGVVYHEGANAAARNDLFGACMRAAGFQLMRQADLAQMRAQATPASAPAPAGPRPEADAVCYNLALGVIYHAGACWNQDHPASAAEIEQFRARFASWAQQPLVAGGPSKRAAPGTRVYISIGGYLEYAGSDGPMLFFKNADRQVATVIGGIYGLDPNQTSLPVDTVASLWPLAVGSSRSFQLGTKSSTFDVTLSVVRREKVSVPAGSFDTIVVERHLKGRAPNYHDSIVTMWFALGEGIPVKADLRLIAGTSTVKPWEALRIEAPSSAIVANAPPAASVQPVAATSPVSGNGRRIPLQREGGVFVLPVLINNAITLKFILDSGASDVSIPADVVMTLIRAGTIAKADFLGKQTYQTADGTAVPSERFRIRSLKVGDIEVSNVVGSVASVKGPLLLGQSFLSRLSNWSIDNSQHAFVMN